MPHHKSCIKRLRQAGKERVRNNAIKTVLRKTVKDARSQLAGNQPVKINELYSTIDRVCRKGTIHKRKAARLKSRLAKAASKPAQKPA